jgi:hypothetical protein
MSFLIPFILGVLAGGTVVYLYYSKIEAKYNAAASKLASYEAAAKNVVKAVEKKV